MWHNVKWILLSVIGFLVVISFIYYFRSVAVLVIISAVLSYLLSPFVDGLTERNVPVAAAVWICYGILFFIFCFFLIVVLPYFYSELQGIFEELPIYFQYAFSLWEQYVSDSQFALMFQSVGLDEGIFDFFSTRAELLVEKTFDLISLIPQLLLGSFLVPVITYYFLSEKEQIASKFLMIFPPYSRVSVTTLGSGVNTVLRHFIGGNLIVSSIVAFLTFLGLWFLGAEHAFILGLLYGLLDVIPYFGPFIGAIPVILLCLLQGEVNIFFVILLLFFVQQSENYFISPRILGDQVGLHPVSVILLVLIGAYCGGILGMVLIIPFAAVTKVVLLFFYEKFVASDID